jgi:DNA processing protein
MNHNPTPVFGEHFDDALRLVRRVSTAPAEADAQERLARATWTTVAEPGDRLAGMLIAALGAPDALALVSSGAGAARVVADLRAAGVDEVGEGDAAKALARWTPRLAGETALRALQRAERCGARLLVPGDPGWPRAVADLDHHAPIALWYRGQDEALAAIADSISLVGARAATGYGEHVTMEASAGLVDRGYAIVSGAAYGIDGMAHRAALASRGITIAFLAGGVDRFYPSGHDALLGRIAETGAVLSELPCGEPPTKWRFLQRNRLIAAASRATVVMEAGWRSGSLNTAGHAAALERPLGAVPGPVTSAASAGCHRLIREFDAVCVTGADDIAELAPLDMLPLPVDQPSNAAAARTSVRLGDRPALQLRVLDALSTRSPRTSADIAARSGLSVTSVQATLGVLQLENAVMEGERGWTVH